MNSLLANLSLSILGIDIDFAHSRPSLLLSFHESIFNSRMLQIRHDHDPPIICIGSNIFERDFCNTLVQRLHAWYVDNLLSFHYYY